MEMLARRILVGAIEKILLIMNLFRASDTTPWTRVATLISTLFPDVKLGMAAVAGELDYEFYSLDKCPSAAESRRIASKNIITVIGVGLTRYWYTLPTGVLKVLGIADSFIGIILRLFVGIWRQVVPPVTAPVRALLQLSTQALNITGKWIAAKWNSIEDKYHVPRNPSRRRKPMSGRI